MRTVEPAYFLAPVAFVDVDPLEHAASTAEMAVADIPRAAARPTNARLDILAASTSLTAWSSEID
jgi:hypothetical protein